MHRIFGFAWTVLVFLLLAQGVRSLDLVDGLYFSMAADDFEYIDVVLPDDVWHGMGKVEYIITTETNWSGIGLTFQSVKTEENNTVMIPVDFSSFGTEEGDCAPFTIKIKAPGIEVEKEWPGGVCTSAFPDVDIDPGGGDGPGGVLASNFDIFDVAFATPTRHVRPGGVITYRLFLESYADMTVDLSFESVVEVSPSSESVSLSESEPYQEVEFTVTAPMETGEYAIKVSAQQKGCILDGCKKQAIGTLIVNDELPEDFFTVSLFPENLNVKDLSPVEYRFTIHNYDSEERAFTTYLEYDLEGLSSSFVADIVELDTDEEITMPFEITPKNVSGFYEIKASATSKGVTRSATSYLSTNEMVTDVLREMENISHVVNQSELKELDELVGNWYDEYYKNADYGENLDEYGDLKDALKKAKNRTGNGIPSDGGNNKTVVINGEGKAADYSIWFFIIPVAVIVAVLIFFVYKKSRPAREDEYADWTRE